MSTGARLGILAAIIVVAVVVLVAVGGGSDNKANTTTSPATATTAARTSTSATGTATATTATPTPAVKTIVVRDAKPVGGVQKIEVNKGDQIKFVVKSDTADEIHVHGYDSHKDVPAGGQVAFSFPATIDGQFEVELEEHKEQIAELTVQP